MKKAEMKKGHVGALTPLYRALAKMKTGHKTKTKKTKPKKTKVRKGHGDVLTPIQSSSQFVVKHKTKMKKGH